MAVKGFEDLRIWQAAHALALRVYEVTRTFPASEVYGLTAQVKRAAASAPANIAEGYGRYSKPEYLHFLYYARGSLMETKSFLYLAKDLGYLEQDLASDLTESIDALGIRLNNTIAVIKRNQHATPAATDEALAQP